MSEIFLVNKLKELFANTSTASESLNVSQLLKKTSNKKIDSTTVGNDSATSSMVGGVGNKIFSATSSEFFSNKTTKTNKTKSNTLSATSENGTTINNAMTGKNFSATSATNNRADSATSSMVGGLDNKVFSATSSDNLDSATSALEKGQVMKGGAISATSTMINNKNTSKMTDMDHLISMLTTESESSATDNIENRLKQALGNKMSGGTSSTSVSSIKQFFTNLKNDGVDVNVKLNDLTLSEFFSSKPMIGGGASKKSLGARGNSDGLLAFRTLKDHVAKGLGLSGKDLITKASKVASAVKKEVASQNPGKTSVEESKMAIKYFDLHKEKFQKMCDKL